MRIRERIGARVRALWAIAKREPSSPRQIGTSVGLGAFVACTPLLGFHLWIALGLASLLRQNRIWAMIGSHLSPGPVFFAIAFSEIETAHRLRTGAWVAMQWRDALAHGHELLLDWFLGTALIGLPVAVCAGFAAFVGARRWQRVSLRQLPEARPPSLEFPP